MYYRLYRSRLLYKLLISVIFAIFVYLLFTIAYPFVAIRAANNSSSTPPARASLHIRKYVTVVFRQFEEFENDIADSVQSFVSAYPNINIIIVCDKTPYPSFPFSATNVTLKNVKILELGFKLDSSPDDLNPLHHIKTDFVLFVPDSTRVSRKVLHQALVTVTASPLNSLAIAVGNSHLICQRVDWKYADWTLKYSKSKKSYCDAVVGNHALLVRTSLLKILPKAFGLPFPESLYLQTTSRHIKVQIIDGKLGSGKSLLKSPLARQKAVRHSRDEKLALYAQIGAKAVVKDDGKVQWFGCKKETLRCFPPVQGIPSYLIAGRNTPPCCMRNLRRVALHVLHTLLEAGARCWLETTSLLGAVMRNDLLPWAEYAEIGIHASDLQRVSFLQRGGPDSEGFVWERATKGHYYRVAYSATNLMYVVVLPFEPRNGTMWPVDWVLRRQRDFPERHLHPLAQVQFAGRTAPAPNDATNFLDLKLGPNAVEKCAKIGPKLLYP